jgi:hypothetical protein
MAGTFVVNGSNTTIKLEYTAPTTKIQAIVLAAARRFYDLDAVDTAPVASFDSLTNQQKLDLVDKYVARLIIDAAKQQKINEAILAAIAAANVDLAI